MIKTGINRFGIEIENRNRKEIETMYMEGKKEDNKKENSLKDKQGDSKEGINSKEGKENVKMVERKLPEAGKIIWEYVFGSKKYMKSSTVL